MNSGYRDGLRGLMKTDTINGPHTASQQGVSCIMCYVLLICIAKRRFTRMGVSCLAVV